MYVHPIILWALSLVPPAMTKPLVNLHDCVGYWAACTYYLYNKLSTLSPPPNYYKSQGNILLMSTATKMKSFSVATNRWSRSFVNKSRQGQKAAWNIDGRPFVCQRLQATTACQRGGQWKGGDRDWRHTVTRWPSSDFITKQRTVVRTLIFFWQPKNTPPLSTKVLWKADEADRSGGRRVLCGRSLFTWREPVN